MRGRTAAQSRPPNPLPSGGSAMERISRSRISLAKATRQASMSYMRLLSRQWRLVGKLMM